MTHWFEERAKQMRRSYLVRVTAHIRNLNSPQPDREFHLNTLLPCFSLQDAREMCSRITGDTDEGVRRTCEIVIKVYLDGRINYVQVSQLRSLAEQFADYYSEYADDRGEDTQHDPLVNARIART